MKIALAQINYIIGDFDNNIDKILLSIKKAKEQGADLVVFAELAVSGYPPRDFLEFDDFVQKCDDSITKVAAEANGIAVIIGLPTFNTSGSGKRLHNSAAFICNGKVEGFRHKTLLPTYDIFDEYRYFEPNRAFEIIEYKGERIALTICEDIWNIDEHNQYVTSPMDELAKQNPDIMINIAASPFHAEQPEMRKQVLQKNVEKYNIPLVYVNHVGAQTELLFDGNSQVINSGGDTLLELEYFKEDFGVVDLNANSIANEYSIPARMTLIHDALVMGVKNYFDKLGLKRALLGLSGGIDSAVTAAIAVRALGKENVYGVLMPSKFSSDHSIKDAEDLAKNFGMDYDIINIEETIKSYEKALKPQFKDLPFGIAEENLQARSRGVLVMALSNKFGKILLNTSNKSEAAVGYGTLYGDMNGGLAVIGDVYKTDVFELARYINKDEELIPENTIVKPPSAELRPDQKDSDSLPDYEILDEILKQYIENSKGPKQIIEQGFDEDVVLRILKMVNANEFKRYQSSPILRVTSKAFGMGRRMPIVAKYLMK
ncbi:MAG: NAD+ synthase [Bacteroidota bacterium]|nr:NAD+ synthase [Bacteroidota bacterium]